MLLFHNEYDIEDSPMSRLPEMDNAKFAKLFRDLKLYDKKFTSTDTDIIFNRPEVKK